VLDAPVDLVRDSEGLAGRHRIGIIPSLLPTLLPRFLPSLCSSDPSCRRGPRIAYDGDSFGALIKLVDAGLGVTILPELVARSLPAERQRDQVRRFVSPEPVREIGLLVAREVACEALCNALFAELRDALPPELHGRARSGQPLSPLPASAR
jgi:hypothetical protein